MEYYAVQNRQPTALASWAPRSGGSEIQASFFSLCNSFTTVCLFCSNGFMLSGRQMADRLHIFGMMIPSRPLPRGRIPLYGLGCFIAKGAERNRVATNWRRSLSWTILFIRVRTQLFSTSSNLRFLKRNVCPSVCLSVRPMNRSNHFRFFRPASMFKPVSLPACSLDGRLTSWK